MLEGEIREIDLVARLVELWREQFTGAIRFENDGIIKIIYFKGGDILSASTNDRSDSIDEILMRAGKISREHVKQALAKRKESETLGDALLNLGFITRKELTWARRVQVVGVIRSVAGWVNGSFTIVEDYLPKRDEGTLFPLPQVLVELVVTDQDRARFERALDGGAAVYAKASDFDDVFRRLGLNEDAEAIAAQIDGVKSAADVASASRRDTFNAYKLVHALATLGILTRVRAAGEEPQFALEDFTSAGVADAADMLDEAPPAPTFAPEPTPQFDFDEAEARKAPTLEVSLTGLDHDAPSPSSAWDEPEEEEQFAPAPPPQPPPRMPAWEAAPRAAVPIPVAVEPPADADEEEQWGFDDAQIETAERATKAGGRKMARVDGERRYGLLLTLIVIFILAGAGYFGFRWWQGQQEAAEAAAAPQPAPRPRTRPAPPPATQTTGTTETIAPISETVAAATLTAPLPPAAMTTTTAPVPANTTTIATTTTPAPARTPMQVTAPEPPATAALPAVVPKTNTSTGTGNTRYETMARDFLANATGNFTVQIQILCETSNLDKAMRQGGANVWFVPQTIGARSCYRVFWGHYATREEAQRAMASIPAGLKDPSAAVKPVPKG